MTLSAVSRIYESHPLRQLLTLSNMHTHPHTRAPTCTRMPNHPQTTLHPNVYGTKQKPTTYMVTQQPWAIDLAFSLFPQKTDRATQ